MLIVWYLSIQMTKQVHVDYTISKYNLQYLSYHMVIGAVAININITHSLQLLHRIYCSITCVIFLPSRLCRQSTDIATEGERRVGADFTSL